jgi:hypothetical protein
MNIIESILDTLYERKRHLGVCTLAVAAEASEAQTEAALLRLSETGQVRQDGRGKWGLTVETRDLMGTTRPQKTCKDGLPNPDYETWAKEQQDARIDTVDASDTTADDQVAATSAPGVITYTWHHDGKFVWDCGTRCVDPQSVNTCGTCSSWSHDIGGCWRDDDSLTADSIACSHWIPLELDSNTCGTCAAWDCEHGCCSFDDAAELTGNSPACQDWAPTPNKIVEDHCEMTDEEARAILFAENIDVDEAYDRLLEKIVDAPDSGATQSESNDRVTVTFEAIIDDHLKNREALSSQRDAILKAGGIELESVHRRLERKRAELSELEAAERGLVERLSLVRGVESNPMEPGAPGEWKRDEQWEDTVLGILNEKWRRGGET